MANRTWEGDLSGDWNTAGNWKEGAVPVATDDVRVPPGSGAITSGRNQSGVALGYVIIEAGHTNAIAGPAAYLQLQCTRFECHGAGTYYIDLGASAVSPEITNSANPSVGNRGVYLKGSALATVNVLGGHVGLAVLHGETATATTVRVTGARASCWVGAGVTLTTFYQTQGDSEVRCAATTISCYGGTLRTDETGTVGTFNCYGGTIRPESSGTITTMLLDGEAQGGVFVDFTGSGVVRTVGTLKQNPGSRLRYDPAVLAITTLQKADHPSDITSQAA
jgi:hypothetical protein